MKLEDNILKWYPFAKNATILKLDHKTQEKAEQQYDYVILRGTLEKAKQLFSGADPERQAIEYAKTYLKSEGKILMIVDNKMGIRNYCEVKNKPNEKKQLTKKQIELLLIACHLNYYKFYYPLPSYEKTNVVFTDEFLPNQETIARNITLYEERSVVVQRENTLYLELLEQDQNLFKLFANTYFVECSRKQWEDNKIQFVSFSNMRKPKYSIQTVIQADAVYKKATNEQAQNHIEQIKQNLEILNKLGFQTLEYYENGKIVSQYQKNAESLDNFIIRQIQEGKKQAALQLINRFFGEIKEKLGKKTTKQNIFDIYEISYEPEQIKSLTFTQYGLWDLIFQNAFYIDGQFYFYDQEWIEEGIPIEYIFYRSIQYTPSLKQMLEEENILQQFGMTHEQLNIFFQLDNKLQEKTRNQEVWSNHSQVQTIEGLREKADKEKQEREKVLEDCKQLLNQKDARICFLEENMEKTVDLLKQKESEIAQKDNQLVQTENKMAQMENSISWKITKPLRKIENMGKKEKKNEN